MTTAVLFWGLLKKGFTETRRYVFELISGLVTIYIFFLLIFLGTKTLLGPRADSGTTIEALVVGFLVWMLAVFAYSDTSFQFVREAQVGTLEQIAMSPLGLSRVAVLAFASSFAFQILVLLAMLVLMMATTGRWLHIDVLSFVPLLLLTLMGIQGIGLMMGGLAIVFKRVQSALQILQFVFVLWIAAPLDRFPWIKFLPLSWGNQLMQRNMIGEIRIWEMPAGDLVFLLANSLIWFALGLGAFKYLEGVARSRALLGQY